MRIDKYLKTTKLIKRRTIAQQMLKHEKIFVNGRAVKASYEIKTNDIVTIIHPLRRIVVRVVSDSEYEIINQSNIENL
ncbi:MULTISPECIES: S4 domain-containing protein [Pseudothermotoga]|jgi:ribosomal 50S subunit-recycling heat shock protein|uniref:RNA-binding S4 domain protein n=1 Tax=Pseudothermotoga lettingae (strain ATCC BAA-301 / DSM 14385 / NBRC 107922 / TMO) TaxID=416591 RepID=A8F4I8_PSELT|nr:MULTISPECIES: S4 domain-containing protein [Pseudothermotoga]ABV33072.1 RNA-binding S4 domain protein [Pseudothermotoga lettingae TMO]MDI3494289.1 hypothetical protein [Pseudothermotoga sp.]MDK2884078.1 hypothetical protein [Pseudothermotoga sp.]GLI47926.1 RNA-binding protein [Pseudothermotoga lettingae TMO]HBJ82045.1 RNA-binding protein [Pseudothermotoga sp.]